MHRNRIRVRPAGGSHLASGTSSMAHMSYDSTNESFRDVRATAPQSAESPFAAQNSHTWNAQSPSLLYGADGSGGGWRYVRRIANLAYSTVSGVFGVLGVKPHGEVKASTDNTASTRAFPYSTAHPNISRISPATPAQSCSGAPPPSDETRVADTIELRRPRRSTAQSSLPPPKPPVSEQAPQTRDAPLSYPSVREAPQCQITVNQYFAAPERSIYPMVFTHPGEPASYRGAPAYPSRASLLTAPSSLQIHAKRPRLASPTAAATELRVRKAPKTVTDNDACDASLSNAPSAIPLGSQENSLTVPIGSLATTRLFGKAKTSNNDDASFSAKPAAPLADVPTAKAPLFGGTATPAAAAAAPNLFVFGSKPAEATSARSVAAAPTFGAPKTNSFVKAGPPAVMPDDSGFAPNADSDDDEKGNDKKTKTENSAPAKAPFSFSTAGAKPTFGAAPPFTGAPANPFSFSAKPAEKADTAAAPTFGAPKTNSFVKAGPPAVMPDDSGFAPNADSDDDEKGNDKKTKTEGTTSGGSSGAFSFNVNTDRAKPNFGSGFAFGGSSSFGTSTGASGAAANPFSFPNPTPTGAFGASGSTGFSFTTSKT